MRRDGLATYFFLVFAYTWGLGALYALYPAQLTALLGPITASTSDPSRSMWSNPVLISAIASPTLAALVVAAVLGRASFVDLVGRLLTWRIAWYWYVLAVGSIAALALTAAVAAHVAFATPLPEIAIAQLPALATAAAAATALDPGPLCEELGWRGFALPRLQDRFNGLTAALILGTVWGVWHLPAFFIAGMPQAQLPVWAFMVTIVANSVLMTWVVNMARGSVLPAMLMHWSINRFVEMRAPGAAMTALVFAAAALALVAIAGPALGATRPLNRSG